MNTHIVEMFKDESLIEKVKSKLPYLFRIAELESSRAGKIGMEVGTLRERILVALLIHWFDESNIETEIPTTEPEIDVKVFGNPLSIKTRTGSGFSGVKLIWTVDPHKAQEFLDNYTPRCDILFAQIKWDDVGNLYYIPLEAQVDLFSEIGRKKYIKLPKPGTNPRGVEIKGKALSSLIKDKNTKRIEIHWKKDKIDYNQFERWIDLWEED